MANDSIGSLTAVVRATAGQFATDINEIKGSLRQAQDAATSAGSTFKQAFEIGAAVEIFHRGIELATEAVERFFGAIDRVGQLKRFADEIGATTPQLQGLRYVAAQFHVDAEQLDSSLVKMEKNVGELQAGSKEATEVFSRLGLSVKDLEGLSADQAFTRIGESIKSLGNGADEVDATLKIFGKGAAELVNVFDAGAAAAARFQKEAREAGLILSSEDVTAAEQAEGAMRKLHLEWEGFVNHLAVDAAPLIKVIAERLQELAQYASQHADAIAHSVLEWVKFGAEIGAVLLIVPKVVEGIGILVRTIRALAEAEAIAEAFSGGGLVALAAGALAAAGAVAVIDSQFDDLDESIKKTLASTKEFHAESTKSKVSSVALQEELKRQADEAAKALEKLLKQGQQIELSVRTPMEKYKDTIAELVTLLQHGLPGGMETFRRAAEKAADEAERLQKAHNETFQSTPSIAAADINTMAGATQLLTAKQNVKDIESGEIDYSQQQLEVAQRQLEYQKIMADELTNHSALGIADF